MSIGTEICEKCGQHIPCRAVCPHCQAAHCEVKGVHEQHGHSRCASNSELPAHWGINVRPPAMQTAPLSMPLIGSVGPVPSMTAHGAGASHSSPPNPKAETTVIVQGAEPPAGFDLPEDIQKELGLVK